ncbi:hypothetical protein JX265_003224 [Neoarthrinium moseri]|uniref:Uncharacterized protein n=1 Tax=Neoarthrinium moseri TaxID=1658444 RepID=A0A9P9WTH0_9PEZI|nr:hypothetical protein JX265_003224 [Neoarthrinium moseri]
MGIGTKIKDALHGDQHHTTDTTKTPGSYPSEEVPRTHNKVGVHETANPHSGPLNSHSATRTEHVPGQASSEYTYGSNAGHTGRDGLTAGEGRRDHGLTGTTGTTGTTSTTGVHGNKLTKGHKDPYWGEADRAHAGTPGTGPSAHTGVLGTSTGPSTHHGNDLNAHEVNNRYNNTSTHGDGAHVGHHGNTTGQHGVAASGLAGQHHDNRYESPRTAPSPTSGVASTARDGLVDGRTTGREYDAPHGISHKTHAPTHTTHSPTTGGGMASNLAHRPHDVDSTRRDYKTDEYDAPTSSTGRGHGGLAGAGTGAAAGYGASKMADHHHEHDLRNNEAYGADRVGGPQSHNAHGIHDTVGSHGRTTGTGPGMLDPYGKSSTTAAPTSMLDPYGKESTTRDPIHARGDHSSIGSSELGHGSRTGGTTMGDDHHGPGHTGAKVMHQCHNCGADNDISRHFQKEAVYRMS